MSVIRFPSSDHDGPSAAELAAIDAEWPLIAAELDLLDAEITLIAAGPDVSALDRRRVRRAARRVLAVSRCQDNHPTRFVLKGGNRDLAAAVLGSEDVA